ncbi:LysE family transporter [Aquimarina mytili]|uniref:LysE family transporter n=1 Tax=Aquimarina mytili TaxID=874423 RepID=A0A936ZRZ7_9FLAO|nr:LysE family transporter [Aquimarina mytili]MBL0683628.1 LysE family transporter [Aquimarina mytili]
MILLYLLFGTLIAIVGAIPLGAVNLAVINTAIKENIKSASYIALAAGIGEIVLAFFALHCSMELSDFFHENQWIQISFIVAFLLIGIYFMHLASIPRQKSKQYKLKLSNSKVLTGFSLALLNPPVIIYWILAISLTNKHIFTLTTQNPLSTLLLFFIGIYLGKIGTLYFYGKWGNKIAKKQGGSKTKLHRIIGIALITISVFQSIKFIIE